MIILSWKKIAKNIFQITDRQLDGMTFDKVFEEKISAKNSNDHNTHCDYNHFRNDYSCPVNTCSGCFVVVPSGGEGDI